MARAYESWLRSDDHDKFAAAAVKCQNTSGSCISVGHCQYGNCFGQDDEKWKAEQIKVLREKAATLGYDLIKQE